MSFFEDIENIIIQGTQYEGMELVGYSFGMALLMLPLVLLVSLTMMCMHIVWRVYTKRRNIKRKGNKK